MNFLKVSMLLTMILTYSGAIPPPDNSSPDSVDIQDDIVVSMSNVDDVGLVIVWNGDGVETVAECQWSGGNHGYERKNISKYLTKGTNYIMFVLYNKVYEGGLFFAGGKWSFDFSLYKNGSSIWSQTGYKRQNDAEVKYWKVIKADVSSRGKVSLTDSIRKKELNILKDGLYKVERKLRNGTGIATPF